MMDFMQVALRNPTQQTFHAAIINATNRSDTLIAYNYMKNSNVTVSIETINMLMNANYIFFRRDYTDASDKADTVNNLYATHCYIVQQMELLNLQPNRQTIEIMARFVQDKNDFIKLMNLCNVLNIQISNVFLFRCFKYLKFEDRFVIFETMQRINLIPKNYTDFLYVIGKYASKDYLHSFKEWYNEHGFKRGKWKIFYLEVQSVMSAKIVN